jgi:chromosome partitioning protein
VRVSEASAEGSSIFSYDPKGKAAKAYDSLVEEVLKK